jgi:hypothetical protein
MLYFHVVSPLARKLDVDRFYLALALFFRGVLVRVIVSISLCITLNTRILNAAIKIYLVASRSCFITIRKCVLKSA